MSMAYYRGRGIAVLIPLVVLTAFLLSGEVDAVTCIVGGSSGWTFGVSSWTNGKHFKVGDILVFKYNPKYHNVVVTNSKDYPICTAPAGAKVYKSGDDQIKLVKGTTYILCTVPGHCKDGMHIAATAS
ncbi:hypothetical protein M569_08503 [Genlisea aurea]|uniref:Basic blue protein n=1 Tax=Genlisea aurea TaxID=192259 RepID=S8CH07_9LAMI|nr:hypothetical protein M569_08503 [Genlisea aurea]